MECLRGVPSQDDGGHSDPMGQDPPGEPDRAAFEHLRHGEVYHGYPREDHRDPERREHLERAGQAELHLGDHAYGSLRGMDSRHDRRPRRLPGAYIPVLLPVNAPDEAFWEDVPFGAGVRRVTVDPNGLAALDKPEGVLSHPNGSRDEARSLVRAKYDEADECFSWTGAGGQTRRLWLINRLDSATSGLILVATTGELAR